MSQHALRAVSYTHLDEEVDEVEEIEELEPVVVEEAPVKKTRKPAVRKTVKK